MPIHLAIKANVADVSCSVCIVFVLASTKFNNFLVCLVHTYELMDCLVSIIFFFDIFC